MTATLTSAVAQGDSRIANTKYGPRLVCDFRTIDGEDITLWKSTDDTALANVKRNQSVQLMKDSKGWNLFKEEAPSQPNTLRPVCIPGAPSTEMGAEEMTPEAKRAIAAYVEQLGDLYAYCHRTAQSKLGEETDPFVLSDATRELFQAARDRFGA
jgi:hypothetical protein